MTLLSWIAVAVIFVTIWALIKRWETRLVLIAAGFTGAEDYVMDAFQVKKTGRNTVEDTGFASSVPNVFTAGDMRRGQSLVVWAIREGKEAAREVDLSLMGYTNLS